MAIAKRTSIGERRETVKDFMTGRKIKVECAACYSEEGSYACIRPSHDAYKGRTEPVTKEVLATAIVEISESAKQLAKSGLNRKGIIALLNDDTKLGKGIIETVLLSLENLAKTYTK